MFAEIRSRAQTFVFSKMAFVRQSYEKERLARCGLTRIAKLERVSVELKIRADSLRDSTADTGAFTGVSGVR